MSEIPLKRRDFLRGAAGVALASGIGTTGTASTASSGASQSKPYSPSYFTATEWAFINAAVERLIPADGNGPGGVDAGVPIFLDKQMQLPYGHGACWYMQGPFHPDAAPTLGYQLRQTPRELYRAGIALMDRAAMQAHKQPFAQLDAAHRDVLMTQADQGHVQEDSQLAAAFFALLLRNTREGYFADPVYGGNRDMGPWKMIGFPGARADFTDFIDQQGRRYPYGPVSIDGSRG